MNLSLFPKIKLLLLYLIDCRILYNSDPISKSMFFNNPDASSSSSLQSCKQKLLFLLPHAVHSPFHAINKCLLCVQFMIYDYDLYDRGIWWQCITKPINRYHAHGTENIFLVKKVTNKYFWNHTYKILAKWTHCRRQIGFEMFYVVLQFRNTPVRLDAWAGVKTTSIHLKLFRNS